MKLLTTTEVAEMLHLHRNTVDRLGDIGELKFYRVCRRGDRRYDPADIADYLQSMGQSVPPMFRPDGARQS